MNEMHTVVGAPGHPAVWTIPGAGMEWCQCGQDHDLTREVVDALYDASSEADGLVPHETVVRVTRDLWRYEMVCRFFHLAVEASAEVVAGSVLAHYSRDEAIDITGLFSRTWQGCPEEGCGA